MRERIEPIAIIVVLAFGLAACLSFRAAAQTPATLPDTDPPVYLEQEFVIGRYLHPNIDGLLFPYETVEVTGYNNSSSSSGWDYFGEELDYDYDVCENPDANCTFFTVRKPYRYVWAGDSNFFIDNIYQLHIPDSDKVHIVIQLEDDNALAKFSTWSSFIGRSSLYTAGSDIIENDIFTKTWNHVMQTGILIIDDDSLKLKDAVFDDLPNYHQGIPGCDHLAYASIFNVCWPNQDSIWEEKDTVKVTLKVDRFVTPPVIVGYSPNVFGQKFAQNGILEAGITQRLGEARIQWALPGYEGFTLSALRSEAEKNIHYEYRIKKSEENFSDWQFLDRTYTELINKEHWHSSFLWGLKKQRMYIVNGLDLYGQYTVCLRASNEAGKSEEICDNVRMRSAPIVEDTPMSMEDTELPGKTMLMQNYPNPFNPSTFIAYELARPEYVRLEIFDAAGRSIGVIAEGMQPAGSHRVRFEASGLPSGLYVYRLEAGEEVFVRKMTLVR